MNITNNNLNNISYLESIKDNSSAWILKLYATDIYNSTKSKKSKNNYKIYDYKKNNKSEFVYIGIIVKYHPLINYTEFELFVIIDNQLRFIYPNSKNIVEAHYLYINNYLTENTIQSMINGEIFNHISIKNSYHENMLMIRLDDFINIFR
jgi:hypothetical protein